MGKIGKSSKAKRQTFGHALWPLAQSAKEHPKAPKHSLLNTVVVLDPRCFVARVSREVVPLGGSCLVTKHLENKGLRVCKFPFDWMYSTPYLVRHALLDDFKTFLDTAKCL